jgi:prevent-host-death family protein
MSIKMKNIISITEARKSIFDIAEKIQKQGNHYIFTENGKAKMAVMSAEEYENLMEDLELASDPKFRARIEKAHEDIARGDYVTLDEFKQELGLRLGRKAEYMMVMDKNKKSYKTKSIGKKNK